MSETIKEPNLNYVQAFENQGIAEEYRTSEHFFFETASDGAVYAVPRSILLADGEYELRENGAVVSHDAYVTTDTEIGARSMLLAGVRTGLHVSIGEESIIGKNVHVGSDTSIEDGVQVGPETRIWSDCVVESEVVIGEKALVQTGVRVARRTKVGDRVIIEQESRVGADSYLLDDTLVRQGDVIKPFSVLVPTYRYEHIRRSK